MRTAATWSKLVTMDRLPLNALRAFALVLERGGVRGAIMDAVEAATRRATELGKS